MRKYTHLLLMACASLKTAPLAPDIPTHSLPARSTSCSLVLQVEGEGLWWRPVEDSSAEAEVETLKGPAELL